MKYFILSLWPNSALVQNLHNKLLTKFKKKKLNEEHMVMDLFAYIYTLTDDTVKQQINTFTHIKKAAGVKSRSTIFYWFRIAMFLWEKSLTYVQIAQYLVVVLPRLLQSEKPPTTFIACYSNFFKIC